MVSLGTVIWIAVKPILKVFFIIGTGFFLARKNVLTIDTSKHVSDIVLMVLIPCLTFNKIVTNIGDGDIKNIGVICLTSVLLFGIGGIGSFLLKFITPVPSNWFGGLLVAGILPNVQDITIAMLQTMDNGVIFTEKEVDKGVSYVIIFFTMFTLVLFNLGAFRLIEWDFIRERKMEEKLGEDLEVSEIAVHRSKDSQGLETYHYENTDDTQSERSSHLEVETPEPLLDSNSVGSIDFNDQHKYSTSHRNSKDGIHLTRTQTHSELISKYSIEPASAGKITKILTTETGLTSNDVRNTGNSSSFIKKYHLGFIVYFLQNCLRPCSMALILALIVAFIPWVKALFVHTTVSMPDAPDELPPLSFIMDYTSYVSNAAIPFALLLLGGTIGRIQVTTLPKGFWKCSLALALLRLAILPILGVLWVKALVAMGWVDKDEKILRFVLIVTFGLPSMTSIIYFTASYSSTKEESLQLNCVSVVFITQYPILVISLPILVTYTIKNVLGF